MDTVDAMDAWGAMVAWGAMAAKGETWALPVDLSHGLAQRRARVVDAKDAVNAAARMRTALGAADLTRGPRLPHPLPRAGRYSRACACVARHRCLRGDHTFPQRTRECAMVVISMRATDLEAFKP